MELEVIEEKEMPLLARKRVQYSAVFEKETPSREAVKKAVATKSKQDEEKVIIRHIYTKFGDKKAKVIAHIYESAEKAKVIEQEHCIKKNTAVEEKKEEKPAEEKQEETKTEEKPAEDKEKKVEESKKAEEGKEDQ